MCSLRQSNGLDGRALRIAALLLSVIAVLSLAGCNRTPQLSGEESLVATDALWTAVTSKRPPLVERAAGDLDKLHSAGELSDDAFDYLKAVVASARDGQWPEARKSLKKFISGQRPGPRH